VVDLAAAPMAVADWWVAAGRWAVAMDEIPTEEPALAECLAGLSAWEVAALAVGGMAAAWMASEEKEGQKGKD